VGSSTVAFSIFLGVNPNVRVEYRLTRTNDKIENWGSKIKHLSPTSLPMCYALVCLRTMPISYTDKANVRVHVLSDSCVLQIP
jgi:hypothetical protein